MVELNKELSKLNHEEFIKHHKEYMKAENAAYAKLVKNGYTPQGADENFKTVCVFKYEHPEFCDNPVKCGKREAFHFKNWQEAVNVLLNKNGQ